MWDLDGCDRWWITSLVRGPRELSDDAARLLIDLQAQPNASVCADCESTRLSLPKWDVVKLVRELIGTGDVLCRFQRCQACRETTLVVTARGHS
jgi:hypothetical protein